MTWHLVTFADEKFKEKQDNLVRQGKSLGFTNHVYTHDWLKGTEFFKENIEILDKPRGLGYWLWKPYIILDAMSKAQDGDVIFYIDSGDLFFPEVDGESMIKVIESHLAYSSCLFISYGNHNATWTKKDCFVYMDCDNEKYWNAPQLEAGVSYWTANVKSKEILQEWLEYCKDARILTDSKNACGLEDYYSFKDHRHDQSILSNIVIRRGLPYDDIGVYRKFTFPNA
jgi:hypothetical protein